MASPEVACPDPASETNEEVLLLGGGVALEVGVTSAEVNGVVLPVGPAGCPGVVVHRCMVNRLPSSVSITADIIAGGGCTTVQDCSCGRGKVALK